MGIEQKGIMRFYPPSRDITVTSPEELAKAGISIHTDVIESTWGKGATDRFYQARMEMRTDQGAIRPEGPETNPFPGSGSIDFQR